MTETSGSDAGARRARVPLPAPRRMYHKAVHTLARRFIMQRRHTVTMRVAGFSLTVPPTVFNPRMFVTSRFFSEFIDGIDLSGKRVADIGTGSGILALAAARAGAVQVTALDINEAAVEAACHNAAANRLSERVVAVHSDLLSAVAAEDSFDVIITNPPFFAGEPRDLTDRAWHAGPAYRDIADMFLQARQRLSPAGSLYLLLSSGSDLGLLDELIHRAGFWKRVVAKRSILFEDFHIYELLRSHPESPHP